MDPQTREMMAQALEQGSQAQRYESGQVMGPNGPEFNNSSNLPNPEVGLDWSTNEMSDGSIRAMMENYAYLYGARGASFEDFMHFQYDDQESPEETGEEPRPDYVFGNREGAAESLRPFWEMGAGQQ